MCQNSVALEGHTNVLNRLSRTYGERQRGGNTKWEVGGERCLHPPSVCFHGNRFDVATTWRDKQAISCIVVQITTRWHSWTPKVSSVIYLKALQHCAHTLTL